MASSLLPNGHTLGGFKVEPRTPPNRENRLAPTGVISKMVIGIGVGQSRHAQIAL